jgi:hypothetical protein
MSSPKIRTLFFGAKIPPPIAVPDDLVHLGAELAVAPIGINLDAERCGAFEKRGSHSARIDGGFRRRSCRSLGNSRRLRSRGSGGWSRRIRRSHRHHVGTRGDDGSPRNQTCGALARNRSKSGFSDKREYFSMRVGRVVDISGSQALAVIDMRL